MTDSLNLTIDSEHPVPITPQDANIQVTVNSGDTLYYGPSGAVSPTDASTQTGTIATNQTFDTPVWLVSASTTSVTVTTTPVTPTTQTGAYKTATTPGTVTGRVAVYDLTGNLLGYQPVYNTIT